jgi:predicted alpha/beta superfamily hydrolase
VSHGFKTLPLILLLGACQAPEPTPASDDLAGVDSAEQPDAGSTDSAQPGPPDLAPAATVIRIHYPSGTLALRGDVAPLDWSQGVALSAQQGVYTHVIADLKSKLEFKPLLDDTTWSRGPNYTVMPGQTLDVYPHFQAAKGKVVKLLASFHSNTLDNDRVVWAYLPPSYDENTEARYPVVYMHDGQNLFDPALAFGGNEWKVDETLDQAAEVTGAIREAIVIGPENAGAKRIYEYTPTTDPGYSGGGGGDQYLSMLVTELKPKIDGMLRTLPAREHTAILGSSLGGLISAYAGVKRPDVFGLMGAMSPSTWWNDEVIVDRVKAMGASRPDRVYVDCGTPGDGSAQTQHLMSAYLGLGYVDGSSYRSVMQAGAQHSETYWAQRLPGALAFLLGSR